MTEGFGQDRNRNIPYGNFIGNYVFIRTLQGDSTFGLYTSVSEEGDMKLNPYQNYSYSGVAFQHFLCEDDIGMCIKPEIVSMIRSTTRDDLENMVRYLNRLERFEEEKRRKEFSKNGPPDSPHFHLL